MSRRPHHPKAFPFGAWPMLRARRVGRALRAVQEEEPVKPAAEPGAEEPADEASGIPSGTGDPQPKPDSAPQPEQARVIGKDGKRYPKKRPAKSKPKRAARESLRTPASSLAIRRFGDRAQFIKKPSETIEDFIKLVEDARLATLSCPRIGPVLDRGNFAAALGFGRSDLRLHRMPMPQERRHERELQGGEYRTTPELVWRPSTSYRRWHVRRSPTLSGIRLLNLG